MKTPQRNFVVEFKSVRRQPKVGNSSIWGDTDLKSLVREVEGDTPHLFNLQQASPIHGNNDDTPSNNVSAGAPAEDSARLAARQPAESLPNEVQSRELDQPSAKTSIVEISRAATERPDVVRSLKRPVARARGARRREY